MELSIDRFNELIEASFGKRFKGNYRDVGMAGGLSEGMLEESHEPGIIAKERNNILPLSDLVAGMFWDQDENCFSDGSKLVVKPRYAKQAIRFSQAYECETGKVVSVHFHERYAIK